MFRMKVQFKVQHQVLSGLKYVQVVKRGMLSNKSQEMIVSRINGVYRMSLTIGRRARTVPARKRGLSMRRNVRFESTRWMEIPYANICAVEADTAPSGMLARATYHAVSRFVDDDNETHLQFKWSFEIKKDWK